MQSNLPNDQTAFHPTPTIISYLISHSHTCENDHANVVQHLSSTQVQAHAPGLGLCVAEVEIEFKLIPQAAGRYPATRQPQSLIIVSFSPAPPQPAAPSPIWSASAPPACSSGGRSHRTARTAPVNLHPPGAARHTASGQLGHSWCRAAPSSRVA